MGFGPSDGGEKGSSGSLGERRARARSSGWEREVEIRACETNISHEVPIVTETSSGSVDDDEEVAEVKKRLR